MDANSSKATTAGTLLISEMTAAAGTKVASWMPTAARLPESDSRKVSQQQQGCQQEQPELTTRTLPSLAETKGTSQTSKAKRGPERAGMPTTALASAGTPTTNKFFAEIRE